MATNENWNHNDTSGLSSWQNNILINSHGDHVSIDIFEREFGDSDEPTTCYEMYEMFATLVVDGAPQELDAGMFGHASDARAYGLGVAIDFLNSIILPENDEPGEPERQADDNGAQVWRYKNGWTIEITHSGVSWCWTIFSPTGENVTGGGANAPTADATLAYARERAENMMADR